MSYRHAMQDTHIPLIQQFDVFAQLVATGNINSSARLLKLPAASVVEAMDGLENRLNCRLFSMDGTAVSLTPTGEKLVQALGTLSLEGHEKWIAGVLNGEVAQQEAEPETLADDSDTAADRQDISSGEAEASEEPDSSLSLAQQARAASHNLPSRHTPSLEGAVAEIPPGTNTDDTGDHSPEGEDVGTTEDFITPTADLPDTLPPTPPAQPQPATTTEPVRSIMLASHPAIFSHFQEALVAFEEASPDIGISLRLESIDAEGVKNLFAQNLADIAYFYALEEPDGLNSRYAWSERISLFVAKGHPLSKKNAVQAEDFARFPYATLAAGNVARTLAEKALYRCGLEVAPPVLETDNLYELLKHVESQPCYFAAFGSMARDFGKMSGITRLAYAEGLPQVQVRQAVRPELQDDPALLALSEFLFR